MPSALVIADSEWVVNDVFASLPRGDWEVEVLDDPVRSAEKVIDLAPEVVIVDLQVRNMGGMAVVREIKASITSGRPRLVLLLDREVDDFLAKRAGADSWVVKPFSAHDLRQAMGAIPAV